MNEGGGDGKEDCIWIIIRKISPSYRRAYIFPASGGNNVAIKIINMTQRCESNAGVFLKNEI